MSLLKYLLLFEIQYNKSGIVQISLKKNIRKKFDYNLRQYLYIDVKNMFYYHTNIC